VNINLSKNLVLICALLLSACDGRQGTTAGTTQALDKLDSQTSRQVLAQMEQVRRQYAEQSLLTIDDFGHKLHLFLQDPGEERLDELRNSWLLAHNAFTRASFFSFNDQSEIKNLIDAWPIQRGFIDSTSSHPQSGIINDLTLDINAETLRHQHGVTDSLEVSLGFHSLEFLIFDRKFSDYNAAITQNQENAPQDNPVETSKIQGNTEEIVGRRRQMLKIVFNILEQDLRQGFISAEGSNASLIADTNDGEHAKVDSIRLILKRLLLPAQSLFAEVNYIGGKRSGHSGFSQSSWENLRNQHSVLVELSGAGSMLAPILTLLDEKSASDYQITLTQAQDILLLEEPDAEQFARMPLLFAALGHQLEDMQTVMRY
jgi:hypothetical protein